ncbi:SH2 domain-containing protein 5 isoform X2 [Rana temporaria]|uniref:SH2 domain-containing protein 5 isoform X2 n=1 Tax=Rana temporaria TaxID=8407 RepID=UPI001AACF335|nr:SH2 domain-containing protein 5 isoform X2 [Rana temporaria]
MENCDCAPRIQSVRCEMQKSCPEGSSAGPGAKPRIITKFAEYVGSFPVKEADSRRRVWIIEEQMRFLKDCPRRRAVTLKFCLQGVKMYDAEGETLLMAHALRRIQYTTCRPEDRQFAFVSRNPHRPANQLFCHLFVGGQPSEAQVLNLLLCRSFQLQYLYLHPEMEDMKASACAAPKGQRKGFKGGVIREPLDPEQVTPNVNALVSFRRLPGAGEDGLTSSQSEISEGANIPRSSSSDTPYCSPTLVRKKAIRSKVIRCGAYRCPNYESQLRSGIRPQTTGRTNHSLSELSEKPDVLVDAVWFCAGIDRDSSLSLLKEDRMGAFLLRPDPGCSGHFTLYMSTQCGVIPYKIYTNQKAKYCFEHLPQQFPSLASLVEHHAGAEGSLFFQLAHGRVNPCYETEDPRSSPPSPRETEDPRSSPPSPRETEDPRSSPPSPRKTEDLQSSPPSPRGTEDPRSSPPSPRKTEDPHSSPPSPRGTADTEQRPAQEEKEEVTQRQDEGSPTDAPTPFIHLTI